MSESEVTSLKVELTEIKTTLKSFINDLSSWKEQNDRISFLEHQKLEQTLTSQKIHYDYCLDNLNHKIILNRKLALTALVTALASVGIKTYTILN